MHNTHAIPQLHRPRLSAMYGLKHLVQTQVLMQYAPQMQSTIDPDQPRRKSMVAPVDSRNLFVKPIRQDFVRNGRLSPGCRLMLILLSGWAGQGGSISTTTGIIGKHLSRCRRQVYRYLKDAISEGYLCVSHTKDRIGRYTGIKIWLNFDAIRHSSTRKKAKPADSGASSRGTYESETNEKYILDKEKDSLLWDRLASFAVTAGYIDLKPPPS